MQIGKESLSLHKETVFLTGVCKMFKFWKCKIFKKKKTCFSKTRGILLWKSEVFSWAEENWGTERDYTVAFEHIFGCSGLVCTLHPVIFSWQRVFRLLSLLFCISRRKLYFITNAKVLFYYMNINPSKGKENKAHLCLSLLIPEDADTSLTLAWNCTSHSLYFTTGCVQTLFYIC